MPTATSQEEVRSIDDLSQPERQQPGDTKRAQRLGYSSPRLVPIGAADRRARPRRDPVRTELRRRLDQHQQDLERHRRQGPQQHVRLGSFRDLQSKLHLLY